MGFLDFVNLLSIGNAHDKLDSVIKSLEKLDKILYNHENRLKRLEDK